MLFFSGSTGTPLFRRASPQKRGHAMATVNDTQLKGGNKITSSVNTQSSIVNKQPVEDNKQSENYTQTGDNTLSGDSKYSEGNSNQTDADSKLSEDNKTLEGRIKQSQTDAMQSEGDNKISGDNRQLEGDNRQSEGDDNAQTSEGNSQSAAGHTTESASGGEEKDEPELSEDPQMVWLRRYFAKSLGICFEPPPEHLIDEVSFEGIARYMGSDRCNKIVVMTGAGISTSAGIPDFRSPNTGCYEKLKKEYNIENPQQLFQFSYFKDHPEPYYKYRKELWRCTYKPTPCHYFIRLLEKKNKLLRHFTQNIDGLETLAGISEEKLIQAHGTMATAHCMKCGKQYSQHWVKEKIFGPDGPVPRCDEAQCGGLVRPDIVMFGENLPDRFGDHVSDIDECDLLLILGTSLVVQPFANLPIRTKDNVPRLYINLEKTKTANHPISVLFFGGGFDFDKEDNIRDVFWQGKCDEGCYGLADLVGWGDDLRTLVKEEHTRLNKELGIEEKVVAPSKTNVSLKKTTYTAQKLGTGAVQKQGTGAVPKSVNGQSKSQSDKSVSGGTEKSPQKSSSGGVPKSVAGKISACGDRRPSTIKQTSATKHAAPNSQGKPLTNGRK